MEGGWEEKRELVSSVGSNGTPPSSQFRNNNFANSRLEAAAK